MPKPILLSIASFIIILDRLLKFAVSTRLVPGESVPVIDGIFHITLVHNRGGAFGILRNQSWFFLFFSVLAIVAISAYILKVPKARKSSNLFSLCFILGGAVGNLIDRISFGYVIDFIDLRVWPVFNLADSAITVGAGFLIWKTFRGSGFGVRGSVYENRKPRTANREPKLRPQGINLFLLSTACYFLLTTFLFADTVRLKEEKVLKGLVVERFVDRIILSTAEGEEEIMLERIEDILYDREEQNLFVLGSEFQGMGRNEEAAAYYKMALEINPDYKEAKEAYIYVKRLLWENQEQKVKRDLLKVKSFAFRTRQREEDAVFDSEESLRAIGMSFVSNEEGWIVVENVRQHSPADKAGMEIVDRLTAIWGKKTRWMSVEEVVERLTKAGGSDISDVRLMIQRRISIPVETGQEPWNFKESAGILLEVQYEGLTITELNADGVGIRKGLRQGDRVVDINGKTTRYLTIKEIELLLNDSSKEEIVLVVERDIFVRRQDISNVS